ncbi:Histidine kinase-, DNA gyrase B-, and HSP90-like ATPase [Planctomycetes bacterium Poly30]|uniref:histidine kinase n=1 Tax=Saltatorellus ferox TaxID=2528018 RepID=A0A518EKN5_9BACT|nr:Histidine kinase-, DNA gyrase B-, and HSP90-like ATPase [Planctomycetes bacterium Poly30]
MRGAEHKLNLTADPGRPEAILHDLRNLLMTVSSLVQKSEASLQSGDVHRTERLLEQLNGVVNDTIAIASLSAAKGVDGAFAPAPYVTEHVAAFAELFDAAERFSLTLRPRCSSARINMPRVHLLRVLTNLVRNAQQASEPDKEVELTLDLVTPRPPQQGSGEAPPEVASEKSFVSFRVSDRGTGFDAEDIPAPLPADRGRRGLGLQVATGLLREAGGSLKIVRRSGGGMIVEALVPVAT